MANRIPVDTLSELERALQQMKEAHKLEREAQHHSHVRDVTELTQAQAEALLSAQVFEHRIAVCVRDIADLPDRLHKMIADDPDVPYVMFALSTTAQEYLELKPPTPDFSLVHSVVPEIWIRINRLDLFGKLDPPEYHIYLIEGPVLLKPEACRPVCLWKCKEDGVMEIVNNILSDWRIKGTDIVTQAHWTGKYGL